MLEKKVNQSNENGDALKNTFVTWKKQKGWSPLTIVSAEGAYFTDSSGKRYLDFSSQLMCSNLGHGDRKIIEAIEKQAEKLPYIAPSFNTDVRNDVARKLREILPENLTKYFFGTAGTEANEAAVKIARMFKAKDHKTKIFSFYNSYHGATLSSIHLTGDFRRIQVDSFHEAAGFLHLAPPFCYRCPFGLKYPDCSMACVKNVEYAIKNEGNVAALFLEPVTGTNGIVVPPKEFLPAIREITEKYGVLLVADEVMTGFGRTGEWFAVDHWGVKPDILTAAKGITGAYAPLSITAVNSEIAEYFEDNYFAHGHTYSSHPLMLAAASAAIDEYREKKILEHVRELAPYFMKWLEDLKERHISVGDVRGIGLFGAVELVKNRETREPFNTYQEKISGKQLVVNRVAQRAMLNGVFINTWISHFIIAPPLIIRKEELDEGFRVLDEALKIADKEVL